MITRGADDFRQSVRQARLFPFCVRTKFSDPNQFQQVPAQTYNFLLDVGIQLKNAADGFDELERRVFGSVDLVRVVSLQLLVHLLRHTEQVLGDLSVDKLAAEFFQ